MELKVRYAGCPLSIVLSIAIQHLVLPYGAHYSHNPVSCMHITEEEYAALIQHDGYKCQHQKGETGDGWLNAFKA